MEPSRAFALADGVKGRDLEILSAAFDAGWHSDASFLLQIVDELEHFNKICGIHPA
jgi:hypothetical protein